MFKRIRKWCEKHEKHKRRRETLRLLSEHRQLEIRLPFVRSEGERIELNHKLEGVNLEFDKMHAEYLRREGIDREAFNEVR